MEAMAIKASNRVAAIFLSLLAVGCGGGGAGGETSAALPVAIDLKISKSETYQNDSVELTWSSSSGASCSASGDWGGSKSVRVQKPSKPRMSVSIHLRWPVATRATAPRKLSNSRC